MVMCLYVVSQACIHLTASPTSPGTTSGTCGRQKLVPHQWIQYNICTFSVGFRTGMGKPVVLLKQVWFCFLAHCDTPCTCAPVSWVCTCLLQYGCPWFFYFKLCFLSFFIIFYSLCHNVTEPNMARPAMCTSLLFTINLPPLTPTCIPLQNIVSGCSKYQN